MTTLGRNRHAAIVTIFAGVSLAAGASAPAIPHTDSERREICTVSFTQDKVYPARVPDGAADCLAKAAKALADTPDSILVLIGTADIAKDWNRNGNMRDVEDTTGKDLRFWDIAAYRAIDTKAYLVQWNGAAADHIAARTAYTTGQEVGIYLVEQKTDVKRVFPRTVPIFEDPCTMKPCPKPDEEDMHPMHREKIVAR
jgi:hypothetical protein